MKRIHSSLRRITRSILPRRGSMLIMVIVILVLLALIGTAMISTSRIDRLGTVQNAQNVQIDLLLQSVENLSTAIIHDGLFATNTVTGTKVYKPSSDVNAAYLPYDSVSTDAFLSDRAPSVGDLSSPASVGNLSSPATAGMPFWEEPTPGTNNPPYWTGITLPLMGSTFEAPGGYSAGMSGNPKRLFRFVPTVASATPAGTYNASVSWPFMQIYGLDTSTHLYQRYGAAMPAADTDGDGIADALLFRLPVGELNGVTYYAAVRIIDNGSAINLSTAWRVNDDYQNTSDAAGQVPGNFFPTNVNLEDFLADPTTELTALNAFRFKGAGASITPIDDSSTARTDIVFNTPYDAMWNQLGRRLDNPWFNTTGVKYQALQTSDDMALAYPFTIYNSLHGTIKTETYLPTSLVTNAPTTFYHANDVALWYQHNFDFAHLTAAARNLRPLSVVRNGIASTAPGHQMDATHLPVGLLSTGQPNGMTDYSNTLPVPKVSVNSADFPELWRGFWNVMCKTSTTALFPDSPTFNTQATAQMFSPALRIPATALSAPTTVTSAFEMLQLRAALAAVNTMDLRDNDDNVTSRKVTLYNSAGTATYDVMVYGTEKQPYITEVFADTYNGPYNGGNAANTGKINAKGYVAIELHNPYPTDLILKKWTLGVIDRRDGVTYPLKVRHITPFTTSTYGGNALPFQTLRIPAGGYVVLENFPPATETNINPNDATYRPDAAVCTAPATNLYYVPNLYEALPDPAIPVGSATPSGSEVVLLRIRNANGSPNQGASLGNPYNETGINNNPVTDPTGVDNAMADMVPVDSFDFSNFVPTPAIASTFYQVHYSRLSGGVNEWKFVFPGTYNLTAATAREGETQNWVLPATEPNPAHAVNLGASDSSPTVANSYPAIQLNNKDFPGPHGAAQWDSSRQYVKGEEVMNLNERYRALTDSPAAGVAPTGGTDWVQLTKMSFPFGGFARNGDLLQIPFIGAYKITAVGAAATTAGNIVEMNPVTMDSYFARDGDSGSAASENIGRFCPESASPTFAATDFYSWASSLFDYFTVFAPAQDYLPNVNNATPEPGELSTKYAGTPAPKAVANGVATANSTNELVYPVEGLININTAPWQVLAQIPFFQRPQDLINLAGSGSAWTVTAGTNSVDDNIDMAKLIVAYRDGGMGYTPHGPFKTIFDLNKVLGPGTGGTDVTHTFQNGLGFLSQTGTEPDDLDGDLSPLSKTSTAGKPDASLDQVRGDFEENFLMLNRISNLITTHSDSFTVYIALQGWQNVNTPGKAQLVVQRHAALIVNRASVIKLGDAVKTTVIPTN